MSDHDRTQVLRGGDPAMPRIMSDALPAFITTNDETRYSVRRRDNVGCYQDTGHRDHDQ